MNKSFIYFIFFYFLGVMAPIKAVSQVWIAADPTFFANNFAPFYALSTSSSGKVYAAGEIIDNSTSRLSVSKYNGLNWQELGNGININGTQFVIYSMAIDLFENLYAVGSIYDSLNNPYVAKWDGTQWSKLGASGTNYIFDSLSGHLNCVATDNYNNVYAAGVLSDWNNHYYIIKWDWTKWTKIELPFGSNAIISMLIDASGNIYIAGNLPNGVYKWDGSNWSCIGGSTNYLNVNGPISSLCMDKLGNMYCAGNFTNNAGEYYVAKWNGNSWFEAGIGINGLHANDNIWSLACDANNNIYAGGNFINSDSNRYVAKWDGVKWTELGGIDALGAKSTVGAITVDLNGHVFAGGGFTMPGAQVCIAEYTSTTSIHKNFSLESNFQFSPNPFRNQLTISDALPNSLYKLNDIFGRTIYQGVISSKTETINTSLLVNGTYIIELILPDGSKEVRKVVK